MFSIHAAQTPRQPFPFYTCNKRGWSQTCQIKSSHQVQSASSSSACTSTKYVPSVRTPCRSALLAQTETQREIVSFFSTWFMVMNHFFKKMALSPTKLDQTCWEHSAVIPLQNVIESGRPCKSGATRRGCSAASHCPLKRSKTQQDFMLTKVSTHRFHRGKWK